MADMHTRIEDMLAEFAVAEALPVDYPALARRWFVPLADWLLARWQQQAGPILVGVHGAQGTGKTTLCKVLELLLAEHNCRVLTLSLDDFYLAKSERSRLGAKIHPLLATRGVPGSHEIGLLRKSLDTLLTGRPCRLPRFDKSRDERVDESEWVLAQPADILVLEGWCVGCSPEPETALQRPTNELEAEEDASGVWRRYVNEQLAGTYATLFAAMDYLVMLQAPSLEAVLEWRTLQEHKLAEKHAGEAVMDDQSIRRFVQHYERITRHALAELPARADYLLRFLPEHKIEAAHTR